MLPEIDSFDRDTDILLVTVEHMALLYSDIATFGMSKERASVVAEVSQEALPAQLSVASYTTLRSSTNLSVTLESILTKMVDIISTISETIVQFIKKVLAWFTNRHTSLEKEQTHLKDNLEELSLTKQDLITKIETSNTTQQVLSTSLPDDDKLKVRLDKYTVLVESMCLDKPYRLKRTILDLFDVRVPFIRMASELIAEFNRLIVASPNQQDSANKKLLDLLDSVDDEFNFLLTMLKQTGIKLTVLPNAHSVPTTGLVSINDFYQELKSLANTPVKNTHKDPLKLFVDVMVEHNEDWLTWTEDKKPPNVKGLEEALHVLSKSSVAKDERYTEEHLALLGRFKKTISATVHTTMVLEKIQHLCINAIIQSTTASINLVKEYNTKL